MTLYASFDYTLPDPSPVTGWYDTNFATYTLPDFRGLLQVTQDQFNSRMDNPSGWAVSAGALIAYTAPVPLPQQAQTMLTEKLAAGVAVTSASLPAVNGTYALDAVSTSQIFQIGSFANSFGVFPSGGGEQPYPDINGAIHMFTVPVFIDFLRQIAALVSSLQTQTGVMSQGGTPAWPGQTADLQ